MRWMRDVAVLIGAAAVGLGFTGAREEQRSQDALFAKARDQCRVMEQMIQYHAASKTGDLNARGWPVSVEAGWFEHAPPTNPLLDSGEHPWVEVASPNEANLNNPPVRMAITNDLAQFWYNPYQGIVRARVPVMVSDELAVDTYNEINGTSLKTIFDQERSVEAVKPDAPASGLGSSAAAPTPAPSAATKLRHDRARREPLIVRVHRATDEAATEAP